MSPRLLLSLWRERWKKSDSAPLKTVCLSSIFNHGGGSLTHGAVWALPGVRPITWLVSLGLFALLLSTPFSLADQLVFSAIIVLIALGASRYAGALIHLILIALSLVASGRYLYWRFEVTLGHTLDLLFVLCLGLYLAEFYLMLQMAIGWARALSPLTVLPASLPGPKSKWPTVDVFILCHGQSAAALMAGAKAARTLDWPREKITLYFLDGEHRDQVKELASTVGATYLAQPDNLDDKAGAVNLALSRSRGELIAVFDGDGRPQKDFLQQAAGWFVRDTQLGMLQTPQHFLAPTPSTESLRTVALPGPGDASALLRRSAIIAIGGMDTRTPTAQAHMALTMQARGYGQAYIGFSDLASDNNDAVRSVARSPAKSPMLRMDQPFSVRALRWKRHLSETQSMLKWGNDIVKLILFTAPAAYLIGDLKIIQNASLAMFAAYAAPHLLLGYLAQTRVGNDERLSFWADLRETVLVWYLLIPTTITLLLTEWQHFRQSRPGSPNQRHDRFDLTSTLIYGVVVALNLAGVIAGSLQLPIAPPDQQSILIAYIVWSATNLMLLAALLAVAEEARHIRRHIHNKRSMNAMLTLPSGRTLACMTENFPETSLQFTLPATIDMAVNATILVSIFNDHREFVFSAPIRFNHERILQIQVNDETRDAYREFGVAALARGTDWPRWLPDRQADRPLQLWFRKNIANLSRAASGVASFATRQGRRIWNGSWIQLGRIKK